MKSFTCPVCGGKLNISIVSELAVCGSCGNTCECDTDDIARFRAIYRSAERAMLLHTEAGYREAIAALEAIPFVEGSESLYRECERRLNELQSNRQRRQESEAASDRKSTALGVALLIAAAVFCLAAVIGAVYLAVCVANGTLPDWAVPVVIAAAVLAAVLFIAGKFKG